MILQPVRRTARLPASVLHTEMVVLHHTAVKNTSPIRDNLLMQSIAEDNLQYVYPDRTGASTSSRYSGMTIGKTELIFLIDREKDCVYYFKVADKNHIHITKRRAFFKDGIYSR